MVDKRILITGSNGFLGRHLLKEFKNQQVEILATSLHENKVEDFPQNAKFQQLDITNKDEVERIFSEFRPSFVIHTSALTNVEACENGPEKCDLVNVKAVEYIAEAAKKYGSLVVQISTDFVFDGTSGPYREEDEVNPLNKYGQSKVESEEVLKRVVGRYAVLRTILVFGASDDPNRSNFVLWVRKMLDEGKAINVVDDHIRMPTFVNDLARACRLVIENSAEGIFHISGNEMMSMYEFACRIADFYNWDKSLISPISSQSIGQNKNRPAKTGFVLDKAKRELEFVPVSIDEALGIMH